MNEVKVARGLGWFSVGLGLVEVLATRPLSAFLGNKHTGIVQAFGARELAAISRASPPTRAQSQGALGAGRG